MRSRLLALVAACLQISSLVAQQQPAPLVLSQLTWFARDGMRLGTVGPLADHGNIELSPDGMRVAVAVLDRAVGTHDIWFYDVQSGMRSRFTSDPADENWLVWSADGLRAIFNSFAADGLRLFESPVGTSSDRHSLVAGGEGKWPVSWSTDGRHLLYVTNSRPSSNDIWALPLPIDGAKPPFEYQLTDASENWAAFSPDGRWVAFSSTESGQAEVYVAPFPAGGRRSRVSANGGFQARWRRDGRELYYLAPDRTLMAASVSARGDEIRVEAVQSLFRIAFPYGAYHAFDVTADGARFLVNTTIVSRGSGNVARLPRTADTPVFSVVRHPEMPYDPVD